MVDARELKRRLRLHLRLGFSKRNRWLSLVEEKANSNILKIVTFSLLLPILHILYKKIPCTYQFLIGSSSVIQHIWLAWVSDWLL